METMEIENELQSSGVSEEVKPVNEEIPQAGDSGTPQEPESEEEKNSRALAEDAERSRLREERRQQKVQARINELTAQRYKEEARANELQRQLDEARKASSQRTDTNQAPRREDFESYEDYLEAKVLHKAEEIASAKLAGYGSEQKKLSQMEQAERSRRESEKAFMDRRAALEREIPDFREVIEDWEPDLPANVVDMIVNLEQGPLITYHLAKNPGLEAKFKSAPEYMHGVLIGEMLAGLKSAPKATSAPPPGKPVSSSKSASTDGAPSDPEKYYAWAKKNLR